MNEVVPASAAEVDAIVSALAEPRLAAAGFRAAGRRRWVRAHPPIRHVFELASLKGMALVPRWGLSLDFVPHLKGGALAWHRTDKSALLDLVYDPIDFEMEAQARWGMETIYGAERCRRDAERVLPAVIERACSWLDGVRDIPSALERATWLRTAERPGGRFGFDSYVQGPLAYAFLLARCGAVAEAAVALDRWTATHAPHALREKLHTLMTT